MRSSLDTQVILRCDCAATALDSGNCVLDGGAVQSGGAVLGGIIGIYPTTIASGTVNQNLKRAEFFGITFKNGVALDYANGNTAGGAIGVFSDFDGVDPTQYTRFELVTKFSHFINNQGAVRDPGRRL